MNKKTIQKIKKTAADFSSTLSTRQPKKLADFLNITILERPYKKQLGAFAIVNKLPFIFLNENLADEQKEYIIAHEIGHFLLHKKILKDVPMLRDFTLFSKRENEMEKEANLFAASFMIDEKEFLSKIKEGYTQQELSLQYDIPESLIELLYNS